MTVTEEGRNRQVGLRELEVQVAFERMVAEVSSGVVHASPRAPEAIDRAISNALKRVGEFFEIERDFVVLFSDDRRWMDNTHEWVAEGVEPQAHDLQGIPVDRYPWALRLLRSGRPLVVDDVEALPPEAEAEKAKLLAQNVRSTLAVPLVSDGEVIGYMGLHSVSRHVHWSDRSVALITVVSEIISGAVSRDRVERELRESEERHRRLHEEKELLLREVVHRIHNNMATVQNLLSLRAQSLGDSRAAPVLRAAAAQVQSMQSLYRRLHYTTDMREIDLASYLSDVVGA
ncbi:MAG: GAF domain-containing protein, partial [Spirochaetia bacterium]